MSRSTAIQHILPHYFIKPADVQISTLGEGVINDTFLAKSPEKCLVLQKINSQVFPDPELLIRNLQVVSKHLQAQVKQRKQRWEDVLLIPTVDGNGFVRDEETNLWRALSYIDNSVSVTKVQTTLQATQTGWALGRFHTKLATLPVQNLANPLPGFHVLSSYLENYDQLNKPVSSSKKVQFCTAITDKYRVAALSLERAANSGKIDKAIIHGDPKIGNILFDRKTGRAVSIIDLDTIGPGYFQHDIGDCLRSICNRSGEENSDDSVTFDMELCRATLEGYFQEAKRLFTATDLEFIYDGILAITFELGLRFFTDYLQGNIYFKCNDPEANLQKALIQFTLFLNVSKNESQIRSLIAKSSM